MLLNGGMVPGATSIERSSSFKLYQSFILKSERSNNTKISYTSLVEL